MPSSSDPAAAQRPDRGDSEGEGVGKGERQHYDASGRPLPSISLKWGRTPRNKKHHHHHHRFESEAAAARQTSEAGKDGESYDDNNNSRKKEKGEGEGEDIDWESYYSPEEAAKLRAQGINPALKAEMDYHTKNAEGRGFWVKLGQTAMGGGWIK